MPLAGNFDYGGLMGATRHFFYSPGSKRLTQWSTEPAWLIELYQSPEVINTVQSEQLRLTHKDFCQPKTKLVCINVGYQFHYLSNVKLT